MKECIVETDVLLRHRCPTQVGVGNARFLIARERTCRTVETHVERADNRPVRQVSPAITSTVVTDFTIGTTNLEHVDDALILQRFHELFF